MEHRVRPNKGIEPGMIRAGTGGISSGFYGARMSRKQTRARDKKRIRANRCRRSWRSPQTRTRTERTNGNPIPRSEAKPEDAGKGRCVSGSGNAGAMVITDEGCRIPSRPGLISTATYPTADIARWREGTFPHSNELNAERRSKGAKADPHQLTPTVPASTPDARTSWDGSITEGRLGRKNSESAKTNFCPTQGLNMRIRWSWVCFFLITPLSGDFTGSQTHCEATHHGADLRFGNSRGNSRRIWGRLIGPCRSEIRDFVGI